MSNTRLKGRDVTVRLTQDGSLLAEITAIASATFEPQIENPEEGYLGEVSNRFDEVYNGCSGTIEFKPEGTQALQLMLAQVQRAQGRLPATTQFNLTMTALYPNGQSSRITVRDFVMAGIPFNVSGKNAYVSMTVTYKASAFDLAAS